MQRINYEFNSLGPFVRAAAAIIEGQSLVCECVCVFMFVCVCRRRGSWFAQATSAAAASERHFDKGRRGERGGGGQEKSLGAVRGAGKWQSQQMCNGHNFLNAQT